MKLASCCLGCFRTLRQCIARRELRPGQLKALSEAHTRSRGAGPARSSTVHRSRESMAAQAPLNCACHHRSIRPRTAGQAFAGVRSRSSTASCEVLASCQSSPTHHRSLRLPQTSAVRRDVRVYNRKRNSIPKDARGPDGMVQYETMLVLRPDLSDDSRDVELAKFQSFLEREKASNIVSNIRTVQQLAYPIAGYWNAIYVLFSYSARRSTAVSVQSLLSKPAVGSEKQILRFGTFRLA